MPQSEMQILGSRVAMLRGRLGPRCGRCGRHKWKGEAIKEKKYEKRWEGNKERKKTGIELRQDKQNERKRERKEEKILN